MSLDSAVEHAVISLTVVFSETYSGRSLINTMNNRGPSTLPCGTPDVTAVTSDDEPSLRSFFLGSH